MNYINSYDLSLNKINGLRADKIKRQLIRYNYPKRLQKVNRATRNKPFGSKKND